MSGRCSRRRPEADSGVIPQITLIDFGENGLDITAAKKYVPAVVLDLTISMGSTREGGFQKRFFVAKYSTALP
jgi:hypothetical protein